MKKYVAITGSVRVEITSADLGRILDAITSAGNEIYDIVLLDELTGQFTVSRADYAGILRLCEKRDASVRQIRNNGLYWLGRRLLKRPILVCGMLLLLFLTLWLPGRVLFVRVEGNSAIPTRKILDEAAKCGIGFGATRRDVRSEQVKNRLLGAIQELQWAGINTEGTVAVIQVRERADEQQITENSGFGHIVAVRDGVITSCTATRGSLLCAPGHAVQSGDILISGYTDCGLTIRAEQAEGEIYALTSRELDAIMSQERTLRLINTGAAKKISLLLGKKRINLWKDSGIWDSTCDRMYEEYYITLPGGFQLPMAFLVERYVLWETGTETIPQTDAQQILLDFGESYLHRQMLAGKVLKEEHTFLSSDGQMTMAGQYICMEMIGKMQRLQIGEYNGESN